MPENIKVALVTGAGRRVGAKIAETLAGNGYRVAIHYGDSAKSAGQVCDMINLENGKDSADLFQGNLTDESVCTNLPQKVVDRFGRIDLLVNNASIFSPAPIDPESLEKFMAIHLTAPLLLSEAAKKLMAQGSAIVNITDLYTRFAKKGYTPYAISKSALESLTRELAAKYAEDSICVNAIAPGAILDPVGVNDPETRKKILQKIPLGRFGDPADIARTVLFLAESPYITGQSIVVDGGRSLGI